ncbi:hypothetical protein J7U46_00035 [Pelomonas sp. V22]|uniref:hypothetical protein n=1 Tax=Pelomonas sp. V22 TaxID=2822139 RepID=UPI0024A8501F|nr:hypothetical protein [Pelomonas sp. V22]MDI4631429.1 hypothetical protein [Pelomonas sp. V22]
MTTTMIATPSRWTLLLLPALLAACNGSAPPPDTQQASTPAASTTACARLSPAQAALVLRLPTSHATADKPENCSWNSGREDMPFPVLTLSVNRLPDAANAARLFEAISSVQSKLSKGVNAALGEKTRRSGRAPEGLGDEAWLQTDDLAGADTTLLVVRAGHTVYAFGVVGMGMTQGLGERLEAAGRSALAAP